MAQLQKDASYLRLGNKVCCAGDSMPYTLDGRGIVTGHNSGSVQTVGICPDSFSIDSQQTPQYIAFSVGQISNGPNAVSPQLFRCCSAYLEEIRNWQRPYLISEGITPDFCYSIRLLHIRTEFGKDFIETDANGNGKSNF